LSKEYFNPIKAKLKHSEFQVPSSALKLKLETISAIYPATA
jgi:hypothetical protein